MSKVVGSKKVKFETKIDSLDVTITFERTDFKVTKKSWVTIYYRFKGKDIDFASHLGKIPLDEFRNEISKIL